MIGSPDPTIGNPFWLSETARSTDAAGRFELTGVPDRARFDFLKQGLSDTRGEVLASDGTDNRVTVRGGGAIKGRVVGHDGKPVRNFRVLVHFPRDRKPGEQTAGYFAGYSGVGVRFTAADGAFVLTGVGAGSVYRVQAVADGQGEAVLDRVEAVTVGRLAKTEPAVLKAAAPARLRVTATGLGDKPVAGVRVTLVDGQPELDQHFSWGYHDASWENMVRGTTDAAGMADFPVLGFAGATVLVQAPGMARRRVGWRDGANELAVKLQPEAVLAGVVAGLPPEAADGFHVQLSGPDGDQVSATVEADAGGKFRVGELPAGKWAVSLRAVGGSRPAQRGAVTLAAGKVTEWAVEWK